MNTFNRFVAAAAMTATVASAEGCTSMKKGWRNMGKETCIDVVGDIVSITKKVGDKLDNVDRDNCLDAMEGLTEIREIKDGAVDRCEDAINDEHVVGAVGKVTADFERKCAKVIGKEPVQSKPIK